jgi:hypothetical protein
MTGCPIDATCGADGLCTLTPCDAEAATACRTGWTCDPEAAATASHAPARGTAVGESEIDREIARGCLRLSCSDEGGIPCASLWSCAPEQAESPSGCVPDPCEVTGLCSSDTQICMSESAHGDRLFPDDNGCVDRLCDEGHSCSAVTEAGLDVGVCDFSSPNADRYGCSLTPCTQDAECFYDYVCDHGSPQADERGCRLRSCSEGNECPAGMVCDPNAIVHDGADCTTPEHATGGGSGGVGSGGSSASSGGTGPGGSTSAAGTTGMPEEKPGVCRE